jgi:hypothetical protein
VRKNKGNVFVVLLASLLVLCLGISGYLFFQHLPLQGPNLEAKGKTDGWKTYTDNKYGFSFRYPPNWEIKGGTSPAPKGDYCVRLDSKEYHSDNYLCLVTGINADQYVRNLENERTGGYWDTFGKHVERGSFSLGAISGDKLTIGDPEGFVKLEFLIKNGSGLFVLGFSGYENETKDRIIQSFKFK